MAPALNERYGERPALRVIVHSAMHARLPHAPMARCLHAALQADETVLNKMNLTPLQLAARLGQRCTQASQPGPPSCLPNRQRLYQTDSGFALSAHAACAKARAGVPLCCGRSPLLVAPTRCFLEEAWLEGGKAMRGFPFGASAASAARAGERAVEERAVCSGPEPELSVGRAAFLLLFIHYLLFIYYLLSLITPYHSLLIIIHYLYHYVSFHCYSLFII